MIYSKENIVREIENVLKTNKVRYSFLKSAENLIDLELLNGVTTRIQIEFSEYDNSFILQLYVDRDKSGTNYYESEFDGLNKNSDSLEGEILNLVEASKEYAKIRNKVQKKISEIQRLCDEYGLDIEEFITINFELN